MKRTIAYVAALLVGMVAGLVLTAPRTDARPSSHAYCNGFHADNNPTPSAQNIEGTDGADVLAGGGGDDIIHAYHGNDIVCGGAGDDEIYLARGADHAYGNYGFDYMNGGYGNDHMYGNQDFDGAVGGPDEDWCYTETVVGANHGCEHWIH